MEWKCKDCGKVFSAKNKLDKHRKDSGEAKPRKLDSPKLCPRCGCEYNNFRKHKVSCSHRYLTTEEKHQILSDAMKKAHAEGRHKGWAYTRKNKFGMSYPEKWFMDVIQKEFIDRDFEYNLPFMKWKLDFAWPKKKLVIEIDGSQHNEPIQKESDIMKDSKLLENGWKVLRLSWSYICNNTKDSIKIAKDFIDNGVIIEIDWAPSNKNILKMEQRNKLILEGKVSVDGRTNPNILSKKELESRKEQILNSGVDLSKFGWVAKVSTLTGLSKHQILNTVRYFNMNVFIRKTQV